MKKIFFITALIFVFSFTFPTFSFAQGMMGNIMGTNSATLQNDDGHTAREEAEGKAVWEKLQAKKLTCKDLTDDNYGALGEYFMGRSIDNTQRHIFMNEMMKGMMGEKGEKQMHVIMGKRLSSCKGGDSSMMGNFGTNSIGWFGFGWVFMILFWGLVIFSIIALIRYLGGDGQQQDNQTPVEILKERYAKGEIDKKEFEEMKKELL